MKAFRIPVCSPKLTSMHSKHSNSRAGIIAGSVVAAVGLLIIAAALFWYRRSKRYRVTPLVFASAPLSRSASRSKFSPDRPLSWIDSPHTYSQVSVTSSVEIPLVPNRYRSPSHSASFPHPRALPQLHISSSDRTPPYSVLSPIPHTPSPVTPPVDIDTLIEMIAHRIDAPRDPDAPLPKYPGYSKP